MEKIKVVWLCQLSNKEIQGILKPHKAVKECAPWMFVSIKIAEKNPALELHIVASHEYINGIKEFELRGIHYHFFNPFIPYFGRHWPRFFKWDYITNFRKTKVVISKIIESINPDVVHLFGAENPQYSAGIIPIIEKYPTILTVQGFMSHTTLKLSKILKKRIKLEQQIFKNMYISFYRSKKQRDDILCLNPDIELYYNTFGSYKIDLPKSSDKKNFDIVFFARICKDKGIIDLLKATAILKQNIPNIKLIVIGGGNIIQFKQLAEELEIRNNVIWKGFLPTRQEVFELASQCRVSVLPTYHDILPGTIIESMFLGIPVVSYDTDSNPEINENGEAIKLVKKGDINGLAQAIYNIISDECLQLSMSHAGQQRAEEMFNPSPKQTTDEWLLGYSRAIEIFNNKYYAKP